MKPIGQTFFINEPPPPTGVDGVFLTKIDVFFKSVSTQYGIEMQIRTTENGLPTSSRLPFASKILLPADVAASDDATVATTFTFDTPIFLQSNKLYAFVLIPLGGNPDYNIWTGKISDKDVTTNTPIYTNNSTGDLFVSSNDLSWQPVYVEDIKFNLYTANFTSTEGHAFFKSPAEEWFTYKDPVGTFKPREFIAFGDTPLETATFTISSLSGTFANGQTVYQGNSSYVVRGEVYFANSTVMKIKKSTGVWTNSAGGLLLFNANAAANCYVNTVTQNVAVTSSNITVTMPDTSVLAANNLVYVMSRTRASTQVRKVASVVNSTAITLDTAPTFTDTNALIGKLLSNGAMFGKFTGGVLSGSEYYAVLDASTANTTVNLGNTSYTNCIVIGTTSGASAYLNTVYDPKYETMTPHFLTAIYGNTSIDWAFKGFKSDVSYTADPDWISIKNGDVNEFTDYVRTALSRSNELTKLPVFRTGNSSITIDAHLSTANTKVSPVIDGIRKLATLTHNVLVSEEKLNGYYLSAVFTSAYQNVAYGETITMTSAGNTTTGIALGANSTNITVYNVNGLFTNTAFTASGGASGYITAATPYSESLNRNLLKGSRYISKNVILADGQDSEDMRTYLTAYRPSGTNLLVFAKIINGADNEPFDQKSWSKLKELSSPALLSSPVNKNDYIELQYGFAQSQMLFASNTVTGSSNTTVSVTSTTGIANNDVMYLLSDDTKKTFNVRKVVYVVNSTALVLDRAPSFTSSNAALGAIPGIETTTSAFLYDQNSNIVRYCTNNDVVFDRYIQFAMKIVPVADDPILVPKAGDIRTLCLQV